MLGSNYLGNSVKGMYQLVAIILAVLWVPIVGHCVLEKMPGLEFLQCAGENGQSDCDDSGDACSELENPNYKLSKTNLEVPQPEFAILFHLLFQDSIRNVLETQPKRLNEVPPEISSSWQFSLRTALPPRAPSLIS
jgi:hypothetical protein